MPISPESSHENAETLSSLDLKSSGWIDRVAKIVGEPKYKQTPEEEPDSMQEIAIYYLRPKRNNNTGKNKTMLAIIRNLRDETPTFRIDVRKYEEGKEVSQMRMDATSITLETHREALIFSKYSDDEEHRTITVTSDAEFTSN
jgi:hypothetical protein